MGHFLPGNRVVAVAGPNPWLKGSPDLLFVEGSAETVSSRAWQAVLGEWRVWDRLGGRRGCGGRSWRWRAAGLGSLLGLSYLEGLRYNQRALNHLQKPSLVLGKASFR
jgi:hypothetical protein